MFKSYDVHSSGRYSVKTGPPILGGIEGDIFIRYCIKDTEFTIYDSILIGSVGRVYSYGGPCAVIQTYSKKGLNVAYNLALALHHISNKFDRAPSVAGMIETLRTNNPEFAKYESDVMKYLVLV